MRVVRPLSITLDSSDVADTTYPAYDAGTTYALNDYVSAIGTSGWTHEYRSLIGSNLGNSLADTAKWLDLGPSNRAAMFDDRIGTKTVATTSITVQCTPNEKFDAIAIIGLEGAQRVDIHIENAGVELFTGTYLLNETGLGTQPTDWYEYFFGELDDYKTSLYVNALIAFSTADATITITGATGSEVAVGLLMFGRAKNIATTLYGPNLGIADYSRKEVDTFGNPYLLERAFANKGSFDLIFDSSIVDYVMRTLARVRATPTLFDFNNKNTDFDSLRIFGWYKDFDINLDNKSKAYCSIEAENII